MIQANKPEWLLDSQIEPFNSTAHARIEYIDTIPTDDPITGNNSAVDSVSFFFAWQNDTGQDAEVRNCATLLAVKGQAAGQAWAGYIPLVDIAAFSIGWIVNFQILEMWNRPPTSPIPEGEQQVKYIVDMFGMAASRYPFGDSVNQQSVDVFRGYPLLHRNFFVVPRNGSLVFQVSLTVESFMDGGLTGSGWVVSFFTDPDFLLCPFVELQVGTSGSMSTG